MSCTNSFDFDHSGEISEYELVLLMLCTTRGLCKVVGLDRPGTEELEELAKRAFVSIDRDHSGAISLKEFSDWAMSEPSLVLYLKRFASTRLIYENQVQYDALLKQLCSSFVQFAIHVDATGEQQHQKQQLACSAGTCKQVIKLHCPSTKEYEVDYLVRAMVDTMAHRSRREGCAIDERDPLKQSAVALDAAATATIESPEAEAAAVIDGAALPQMVAMDVFCMISASYVAFIVADEDKQHVLDRQELLILLWLLRGKEPTAQIVESYMRSLDRDQNGVLSALEWVTFAIENDARTGSLSFATQLQLLFTTADRNGDAMLSLHELCTGLKPIVLQSLLVDEAARVAALTPASLALPPLSSGDVASAPRVVTLALEKKLETHSAAISSLIAGLANELMQAMDKNQSHRIEWYEFRQQLDYLEERVREMKTYIRDFVLAE